QTRSARQVRARSWRAAASTSSATRHPLTSARRGPQEGNDCRPSEVPSRGWGMRTLARGAALAAVAAVSALLLTGAASAATPVPRVVGPLPANAASHPFGGAAWEMQPEDL